MYRKYLFFAYWHAQHTLGLEVENKFYIFIKATQSVPNFFVHLKRQPSNNTTFDQNKREVRYTVVRVASLRTAVKSQILCCGSGSIQIRKNCLFESYFFVPDSV